MGAGKTEGAGGDAAADGAARGNGAAGGNGGGSGAASGVAAHVPVIFHLDGRVFLSASERAARGMASKDMRYALADAAAAY